VSDIDEEVAQHLRDVKQVSDSIDGMPRVRAAGATGRVFVVVLKQAGISYRDATGHFANLWDTTEGEA